MSVIPEGITHIEVTDSGANFWSITEPDNGTGEVWIDGRWVASEISDRLMQRLMPVTGTLSHRWTEDPHAGQYDGERADLALGDFTDDELANAVFMHGNEMPDIGAVLAGKAKMPVYLTAAKERIRWLSRRLDATLKALAVASVKAEQVQCDPRDITGDTGRADVDAMIGRLTSADPDFNDCADAAALLRRLVMEEISGPVGYATWRDAAVAERVKALAMWERPKPWGPNDIIPLEVGSITGEAYRRGVEAGRRTPIRVVADISGGALHGVYAEVPVEVIFISDDADDVSAQEDSLGEGGLHRDPNGNLIASWYLASDGGTDAEMVQHYFNQ